MPGYFGYAAYANGLFLTKKSLVPGAYGVMLAVLCLQVVGGVLSAARQPGSSRACKDVSGLMAWRLLQVSVAFGCMGVRSRLLLQSAIAFLQVTKLSAVRVKSLAIALDVQVRP